MEEPEIGSVNILYYKGHEFRGLQIAMKPAVLSKQTLIEQLNSRFCMHFEVWLRLITNGEGVVG